MVERDNFNFDLQDARVLLLDCQTTGASPRTGNLLEIAWSLCDSDKPLPDSVVSHLVSQPDDEDIPARIESITGISTDDMKSAVSPTSVVNELKKLTKTLNRKPLCVIHYARFETPFLEELFLRYGKRKTLPFEIVCTFEIAKRLYPNLPSRGIRAIGGFLGLELDELKRARNHVLTTREIWKHLILKLQEKNVSTYQDLGEFLGEKPAKRTGKLEYPLEPKKRLSLPDTPGVYRMLNRFGKVLYIGKATSLKSRVNSHFRGRKAKTSRSFELLTQVTDLEVEKCNSPLEASLVEADLIKENEPTYNTSLKTNNRKLWFYSPDFMTSANKQSKKFPLGPFSSSSIVEDVQELSICLEQNTMYCGDLYGIDDGELIAEALDLFVDRYGDDLEGDYSVNRLLLLGLNLYRWKRNLLREAELEALEQEREEELLKDDDEFLDDLSDSELDGIDDDNSEEEEEEEEEEVELTALDVLGRFESMIIYMARAYLRSKELTRLLNSKVLYKYKSKNCLTAIQAGELSGDSSGLTKTPKQVLAWKKLDLNTFDRMRVLATEIGRMRTSGESIEVEPAVYFLSRWKMI